MSDKLEMTFGCAFALAVSAFGIFQIYAAFLGWEHSIGYGWAIAIIVGSLFLQSSLFIVIGAFLGAKNVWGWEWYWSAAFAAPMLILIIPSTAMSLFSDFRERSRF